MNYPLLYYLFKSWLRLCKKFCHYRIPQVLFSSLLRIVLKHFFRIPLKRMDSARSSLQGFSDSKKKILNRWQRTNLEYFPHENITNYMDVSKHIVCFWDYFCHFFLQSYVFTVFVLLHHHFNAGPILWRDWNRHSWAKIQGHFWHRL